MCEHSTAVLIQEKLVDSGPKKYYCFSCRRVISSENCKIKPVADLRFIPLDYVKKKYS